MIAILDYGAGNLRSVQNTLEEIGAPYRLVRDAAGLRDASKIILPGVGHFGQMLRSLDEMQVREPLAEQIARGVPFLGICLGLQALFESSEEAPEQKGLALFPGIPVTVAELDQSTGIHATLGTPLNGTLGLTFIATGTLWCLGIAAFAARAASRIRQSSNVMAWVNRVLGGLFVYLGIRVAMLEAR